MSIISCTSPSPSESTLPTSRVTSLPSAVLWSRRRWPSWRTTSPRFGAGQVRHSWNASTVILAQCW